MTSWKPKAQLLLLVFVCTIYLSHGGCHDYLKVEKWKQHLIETLPLVNSTKSEDMMECSLERAVINQNQNTMLLNILNLCFDRKGEPQSISEKCQGDTSETVPFYHFMCLTAEAFNKHKAVEEDDKIIIEGCKYDTVCRIFSGGPLTGSHQTTMLPPTTITTALPLKVTSTPTTPTTPTPTTAATTTTITPPPPPTTTTATPTTTTTAPTTATPTTTTTPPPTTTTTTTAATTTTPPPTTTSSSQTDAERVIAEKVATENLALKIFSVVSAAFNMVLFMVMLYRCKRNQRKHDCDLSITTHALDEASLEARPMAELKSCTMRVTLNEDGEVTKHLMQSRDPDSISTQAELTSNEE